MMYYYKKEQRALEAKVIKREFKKLIHFVTEDDIEINSLIFHSKLDSSLRYRFRM